MIWARLKQLGAWLWIVVACAAVLAIWFALKLARRNDSPDWPLSTVADEARTRIAVANVTAGLEIRAARANDAATRSFLASIEKEKNLKRRLERLVELRESLER